MSENETPAPEQNDAPDVDAFDISDWLETGNTGRTSETVIVHRDPSLLEEARRLNREADKINAQAEVEAEDLSVGEASAASRIQAEVDDLDTRIKAQKAEVAVHALSDGEVEDVEATFKKRYPGEKRAYHESVKGTCLLLAEAATFNGQRLTADHWRKLSEGPLAGGQWEKIKGAWLVAQRKTPRVDNPFSQSS